jgi:predicted Fe-Mo cluster-binding NifX family protein
VKIAIPLFGDEVSPRFGCSTQFWVTDNLHSTGPAPEEIEDVGSMIPRQVPAFLQSLGVTHVICGGLHHRFQADLEAVGIEVVSGVIGAAVAALAALREGRLEPNQFVCRGRQGRGRGRGRGQGRRGQPSRRPPGLPDLRDPRGLPAASRPGRKGPRKEV